MDDRWLHWVPVLQVSDARRSEDFYCEVLGFAKDWEHRFAEDFPLYVSVSRGPLRLHLSEHGQGGSRKAELFIAVQDVDTTYSGLMERGLEADGPPEDRPYGVRDFGLSDPDGHHLVLGTALADFAHAPGRSWSDAGEDAE